MMNAFVNQFHFLMPEWFALLLPAYGFLLLLHLRKNKTQGWHDIVDDTMREYVVQQQPEIKRQSTWVHGVAIFIAVFVISGPSWTKQPQPVFEEKSALIIALDLSRSMLAEDIKPSRLNRAKFIVDDVLNRADNAGQFSLIAFAQEAFIVTPFTTDKATLINQLRALTPEIMPFQGTNFSEVIKKAEVLHVNNELEKSRLLIVTDTLEGLNSSHLKSDKVDISVLAISTKNGAPIPTGQGDFIKNANNDIVISKLNSTLARALYSGDSIRFRQFSNSDNDLAYLLPAFKKVKTTEGKKESAAWLNQGHYFVWLLLPYFLLWFRKGLFFGLVFFVMPMPQADAFELPNWLLNENQIAQKAYQNKQYKTASKKFTNPNWAATSLYKNGQFAEAEKAWANIGNAQSDYNAGNAAAKQKEYKQAIKHYKKALKKQAKFDDAKTNLSSVENFLKEKEKEKEKEKNQQQKDGDKKDPSKKEQQGEKQQSSDEQKGKQSEQEKKQQQQSDDKQASKNSQPSRKQSEDQQNKQQQDEKQKNALDKEQQDKAQQEKEEQNKDKKDAENTKGSTKTDEKDPSKKAQEALQKELEQEKKDEADKQDEQETPQQQLSVSKQRQLNKTEQWLQQIPDDPGGLLRRKFYYYSQQHNKRDSQQPW